MSTRSPILFLEDIIEAIRKIRLYTNDIEYKQFANDVKTVDAVLRNLEIIGEAVKNIPVDFKRDYSQVEWRNAAGMRDKLIHSYFGIDLSIIWETIKTDIPAFSENITEIMKHLDKETH